MNRSDNRRKLRSARKQEDIESARAKASDTRIRKAAIIERAVRSHVEGVSLGSRVAGFLIALGQMQIAWIIGPLDWLDRHLGSARPRRKTGARRPRGA